MKAKTSHFEKKSTHRAKKASLKRGFFITFEGGEGAGKTTQIKKLSECLAPLGYAFLITREPGGTSVADQIRTTLLDPKNTGMSPQLELLLYEAARRDHVENLISPALKAKKIVICDRFTDSTLAYQGFGRGINHALIENLNTIATGGLRPDLTFLFDLSPKIGLTRATKRNIQLGGVGGEGRPPHIKDRIENEKNSFHEKVRKGFLTLARKDKKRFVIIDATQQPDIIFRKIFSEVEKRLRRFL